MTKNKDHARDWKMHQTKKGNKWHLGLKACIGADADLGLMPSLHTTAANESDGINALEVLHGQEAIAFLDAAYIGIARREEVLQAQAEGKTRNDIEWHVSKRRTTITKMADDTPNTRTKALELVTAQFRVRVEHCSMRSKTLFRHRKGRYKSFARNKAQLNILVAPPLPRAKKSHVATARGDECGLSAG